MTKEEEKIFFENSKNEFSLGERINNGNELLKEMYNIKVNVILLRMLIKYAKFSKNVHFIKLFEILQRNLDEKESI